MRGWAQSVKDFEVGQEAIQWLQVGSSENENKAGRLSEGGWLEDQGHYCPHLHLLSSGIWHSCLVCGVVR